MVVKKSELKKVRREGWQVQLEKLADENPLILHTDAGRTFSMARRMKAEEKMGIPISLRSGFAISTENGKAANAMMEDEWNESYDALSKHLRRNYPDLYARLFSPNNIGQGKPLLYVDALYPRAACWFNRRFSFLI